MSTRCCPTGDWDPRRSARPRRTSSRDSSTGSRHWQGHTSHVVIGWECTVSRQHPRSVGQHARPRAHQTCRRTRPGRWTVTVAGEPVTMAALVAGLRAFGDRPALVDAAGRATGYADLVADSTRLGNALLADGLQAGDRFAFFLPNGRRIVECYLACATSGIVGVPLAARLTLDDMEHQLRDSGARVLL